DQVYCPQCHYRQTVRQYSDLMLPPLCPRCHACLRPDVVLFGEMLPERAMQLYQREMQRGFDLVFSVGTSSVFPYISQPVLNAQSWGGHAIEINPGITEVSSLV